MPEAQRPHAPPRERLRARAGTPPEGQDSRSGYEEGAQRAQRASAEAATRRRSPPAQSRRRALGGEAVHQLASITACS